MSDLQAIADRFEIEALRGEFTDVVGSSVCRPAQPERDTLARSALIAGNARHAARDRYPG